MYWFYTIPAFVWFIMWIADLAINGNNNHGTLACALATFALAEIVDMKDSR